VIALLKISNGESQEDKEGIVLWKTYLLRLRSGVSRQHKLVCPRENDLAF